MRTIVLTVVLIVSAAGVGFDLYREVYRTETATVPPSVPDFVLIDSNNKARSIAEWKGKSLVINFWATWCEPCRREIPLLKKLHAERANQNVQVIGIAVDRQEDVLAYMRRENIDYPVLIGEQDAIDVATKLGVGSIGLPFTVFTDEKGRIVTLQMGELKPQVANSILDIVLQVNRGALSLTQAKEQITLVASARIIQP